MLPGLVRRLLRARRRLALQASCGECRHLVLVLDGHPYGVFVRPIIQTAKGLAIMWLKPQPECSDNYSRGGLVWNGAAQTVAMLYSGHRGIESQMAVAQRDTHGSHRLSVTMLNCFCEIEARPSLTACGGTAVPSGYCKDFQGRR